MRSPWKVAITSSSRNFSGSKVPLSQTSIVPAPYSPFGISPSNSRYSSGWSSVRTASRFSSGWAGIPRGTAHDASVPSCSSRRSQWSRRAWCSCTTKRGSEEAAFLRRAALPPAGSGVFFGSRFFLYAPSLSAIATIFTIGHSTHELPAFLSLLRGAGIEAVADVRRYPSSRRMPWSNSGRLEPALREADVEYAHLEGLGGRREGGLSGYAGHMQTPEFEAELERLVALGEQRPTAVMCAEREWRNCHRQFISDALAARGHDVVHVTADGELE